ncbi:Hypothetical predicted protein [Cloeon dipterum]|uniref:C2H2-type domain-containing protein n=1 Tax=Cloeon dipterum TaxID=197152 RepID=A0A8S1E9D2_9INSE|nr:Hypothetical predicted protein [Cloeon dipterum]
MTLQKDLCLICERPTADGAVQAVHMDKEKLQNWFLNVSGHELAEEIKDEDLICYFCLWHAEFLGKFNGMSDEALVWWPRNSDDSNDAVKYLRKYYFEGKIEQCWVQLEIIELPQCDDEERRIVEAEKRPRRWNCVYCGKRFKYSYDLSKHVKKMHNDAKKKSTPRMSTRNQRNEKKSIAPFVERNLRDHPTTTIMFVEFTKIFL